MTIEVTSSYTRASGNGVTTVFPFAFKIFSASDLVVRDILDSTGVPTTKTLTTDYNVSISVTDEGGSVSFGMAPASGHTIDIRRSVPLQQPEDIRNQGRFLPEIHEGVFDKLEAQIQDTRRLVALSPHLPDSELPTIDWDTLLSLANRKGKYFGFFNATTGAPELFTSVGGTAISRSIIGQLLFPQTSEEISAGKTPSDYGYYARPEFHVRRYGALLNGSDDFAAMRDAIAAAGVIGGCVVIDGPMTVASANASGGVLFNLPSGIEIRFTSPTYGITVSGTTVCWLFKATNKRDITIHGGYAIGNNQASAFADSGFLYFLQDSSATGIGGNVRVWDMRLTNFKGDFWIFCRNTGSTYAAEDFWIERCDFFSQSGNARGPTNIAIPDAFIAFQGAGTNTTGLVRNAWVSRCRGEGTYKKSFGAAWHSTENIWFEDNDAENFGADAGFGSDKGVYAFFAYENSINDGGPGGARPDHIYLVDNRIKNPRSCGFYCADGNRIFVSGNKINGQTDTSNGTLPKGAVAINGAREAHIDDNWIDDCFIGVVLYGISTSDNQRARRNRIYSQQSTAVGIVMRGNFAGKVGLHEATNNSIDVSGTTSTGIDLIYQSANGVSRLIVENNPLVRATDRCIRQRSPDVTVPDIAIARICNNGIEGNGAVIGLAWATVQDSESRTLISGNRYTGTWATNATILDIRDSYALTIHDEEFVDATGITTGFCMSTTGARAPGGMSDIRFNGPAAARRFLTSGSEELGDQAPTWTGTQGAFVQNIPTGAADASNMILVGWRNTTGSTTWVAQYMSTVSPAT